ncbi:MAG: hypothetical protein H7A20_06860 [Rhodanobacteraceae bacterium]|nr:hypothetical protein [Xanthomonadales bacterium]MCP5478490.1 hypothetical protein [Rhodanobacteraceae bacterium]HPF72545.1 hypothetical protein [Xanthomonadaceae bacterium]HRX98718.1 hypothetical protein [Xanthomonadaceae bacterium]
MRYPLLLLLMTLAMPLSATQMGRISVGPPSPAVEGEKVLQPIRADIKVSADGTLTAVRMDSGVPGFLTEPFQKALSRWRFLPAQDKGVPYDWATRVSVWLVAEQTGKGVALKVHDVDLTTAWYDESRRFEVPTYPSSMRRSAKGANVMLLVRPGEGKKRNKVLSALVNGEPARGTDPFAKAAREAVRQWPMLVLQWDGVRYAEVTCVPVTFSMAKEPAERTDAEVEDECHRLPGSTYEEGDEEIRLADDVKGQLL